ncbi:unnamed protein product [Pleuronectes platessa]|uniref:Uncharacterized protein n=1 Tax=Pleuronectes platessa TaxID=8262 RepID=A0A9N7U463_PLEPL|nr:unnamed protein product [Pleuronectes platessa]
MKGNTSYDVHILFTEQQQEGAVHRAAAGRSRGGPCSQSSSRKVAGGAERTSTQSWTRQDTSVLSSQPSFRSEETDVLRASVFSPARLHPVIPAVKTFRARGASPIQTEVGVVERLKSLCGKSLSRPRTAAHRNTVNPVHGSMVSQQVDVCPVWGRPLKLEDEEPAAARSPAGKSFTGNLAFYTSSNYCSDTRSWTRGRGHEVGDTMETRQTVRLQFPQEKKKHDLRLLHT